jgi:hypothetical protein
MTGRPVSRMLDDGLTLEVIRLCTDGTPNAASKLYAAARRIAQAMGYERVLTYILKSEAGTSLFAAGWEQAAQTPGTTWSRDKRPRTDKHPLEERTRWEAPEMT